MSKAILLNTGWTFTKEGHDEPVTLPHTWNAVDGQDGGNDYYRAPAAIPAHWKSRSCPTAAARFCSLTAWL